MSKNDSTSSNQSKQRLAGIFDQAAKTYDQVGPAYFSYFGQRLAEIAQIPHGAKVLDVATGRGAVLFPAAEMVGAEGRVIGIDLSEEMVKETNKNLSLMHKFPNVEVLQMDAENIKFPNNTFDLLLCGFAIFFFPKLYQAMSEFYRVLKPGGHICISTFDRQFFQQISWLRDLVNAYLPPNPKNNFEAKSDDTIQPVFDTPEGLHEILNNAGFRNIKIYEENAEFVYASEEEFWKTLWTLRIREAFERIEIVKGAGELRRLEMDVYKKLREINHAGKIHQIIPALFGLATK